MQSFLNEDDTYRKGSKVFASRVNPLRSEAIKMWSYLSLKCTYNIVMTANTCISDQGVQTRTLLQEMMVLGKLPVPGRPTNLD